MADRTAAAALDQRRSLDVQRRRAALPRAQDRRAGGARPAQQDRARRAEGRRHAALRRRTGEALLGLAADAARGLAHPRVGGAADGHARLARRPARAPARPAPGGAPLRPGAAEPRHDAGRHLRRAAADRAVVRAPRGHHGAQGGALARAERDHRAGARHARRQGRGPALRAPRRVSTAR